MTRKNIVVLHTMVGSLGSVDNYFRSGGYDGVGSHFGVGHDGTVYQWQDTNRQADAQGAGNDNCISIETADSGAGFPGWSGSDVPAWTDAQLGALVDLIAWLCNRHNIPKRLVPDSGAGRRGVGYHRQGVDPWRDSGTERWSSAYGKVCPGDRRIRQIKNNIIPRLHGAGGEDDMSFETFGLHGSRLDLPAHGWVEIPLAIHGQGADYHEDGEYSPVPGNCWGQVGVSGHIQGIPDGGYAYLRIVEIDIKGKHNSKEGVLYRSQRLYPNTGNQGEIEFSGLSMWGNFNNKYRRAWAQLNVDNGTTGAYLSDAYVSASFQEH